MTPLRLDPILAACGVALLVLTAVMAAPGMLTGSDLYWQIASGRWMIENQAALRIDPFSFTYAGYPWPIANWLGQVLQAMAYVTTGWNAVIVLNAVAAALSAGFVCHHVFRRSPDLFVLLLLAACFVVAGGVVHAASALLALPFAVLWLSGLLAAREKENRPAYALLPALVIWANLDPGFFWGLAVVLLLGGEAVLAATSHRGTVLRDWAGFGGLSLLLCLITPYGLEGMVVALRALTAESTAFSLWPLLPAVLAVPILWRRPLLLRGVFLFFLLMISLFRPGERQLFAAAAPLLLAGPLQQTTRGPLRWRLWGGLAALIVIALAVRLVLPVERDDGRASPVTAFAQLSEKRTGKPVLNEPAFGGFLLFHGVRPFLDDRSDYRPPSRARYEAAAKPAELAKTLTRSHIGWTILSPKNPDVAVMDALPGWRRLYADRWAVVHIRNENSN